MAHSVMNLMYGHDMLFNLNRKPAGWDWLRKIDFERIQSNFRKSDSSCATLALSLHQIGLHEYTPRWQAQVNLEVNDRYLKSETRNVFKCSCRKVKWDNWQFQWDELKPNRFIFSLHYSLSFIILCEIEWINPRRL